MTQTSMTLALAGISFMMTVIWGPPLLRVLRHFKVGKAIRVEGPDRHFSKLGTPTMGGVLIIIPVLFVTGLLNAASLIGITVTGRSIMLPMAVMVAFAAPTSSAGGFSMIGFSGVSFVRLAVNGFCCIRIRRHQLRR